MSITMPMRFLLAGQLWIVVVCNGLARSEQPEIRWIDSADAGIRVDVGPPVVVALSQPGEDRWGFHQFPKLSRLPDGSLLVTFNLSDDNDLAYGHPGGAFISRDEGAHWSPYQPLEKAITISNSPISDLGGGEFLCLPMSPGIDVAKVSGMPEAVGEFFAFFPWKYYRLDECPASVKTAMTDFVAYRWTPQTKQWKSERISYELRDALICVGQQRGGAVQSLARASFEYPLLAAHGNLYYADYRFRYLNRDGSVPRSMAVTCMVSRDGGRHFERRGTIAEDPTGVEQPSETGLGLTSDNVLVAVGRASSEKQAPTWISFSDDEGRTWSPRQQFHKQGGVQPTLTLLKNHVLALATGRPGGTLIGPVSLCFSPDGKGKTWTGPIQLSRVDGTPGLQSCAYTGIVYLGPNAFLLAYSDFNVPNREGKNCKAIVVRRIQIDRK